MSLLTETAGSNGFGKWGMRTRDVGAYQRVAKITAATYLTASMAGVFLWFGWHKDIAHPTLFAGLEVYGFAAGLAVAALAFLASPDAVDCLYRAGLAPALLLSVASVWLTCYAMGYAKFGADGLLYDVVVVLAFYVLRKREAIWLLGLIVVAHAVLLAVSPHVAGVFPQWFYITLTLSVTGLMIGNAMSDIDESRREYAELNTHLERRVAAQVTELDKLGGLRRFLSAPVAQAVLDTAGTNPLAAHRREIAVMFCDMRGITAYARQAEPEDVMEILDSYYAVVGA